MEENQYQQIELADLNQVAVETAEGKRVYENITENRDVCEMLHYETLQNSAWKFLFTKKNFVKAIFTFSLFAFTFVFLKNKMKL